jgi:capsular exopolysaccharide synthesis family protein
MNIISADQRLLPSPTRAPVPDSVADVFGVNAALRMVRRRFVIMACVGAIVGALILTRSMMAPPTYEAISLIAINARQERVIDSAESVLGDLPRDTAAIDTEIEIMRSPALMGQLVDALNLTEDPEYNWLLREPSPWRQFVDSLLNPVMRSGGEGSTEIDPVALSQQDWVRTAIASSLAGSVTIRRRGLTYMIEIAGRSRDPLRAQQLANTFADIYLASQAQAREDARERATAWLAERVEALSADVQAKEQEEQAYRQAHGLTGAADGVSLTQQQLTTIQQSVLQAQADLAERQARYRQLRALQASGGSLETVGDALESEVISTLRDREAEIARRQSELENRYLPTHPAVQAVLAERADVARQIQSEIDRIAINMANEVDVARSRLETLQSSLDEITAKLQEENAVSIRLRELERESQASRRVYESYLERYQEIGDQESMNSPDARLVAHAQNQGWQVSPNLRVALALSVLIGGFCGLVAGIATELLDRSVRSREEVETKLGYPTIATIPTIGANAMRSVTKESRNPPGYLVEKPMSAFTESMRVLRTVIVHSQIGSNARVVAIASALPGEGKTTVALSLARVAALSGQKVIVVDCDLRKQSISRFLANKPERGLLQVLSGEITWADALQRDAKSSADILPVVASSFSPIDVFGSDSMELLLSELRQHYEIIILDCPPLFAVAEARVICALADSVVLVARMGKSTVDAMRLAIDQVLTAGGSVVGVALNRVPSGGLGRLAYGDTMYSYSLRGYYTR